MNDGDASRNLFDYQAEKYDELFAQNVKLIDDMKKIWEVVGDMQTTVKTLHSEKATLEKELNELNAYTRRCNIEIRNVSEDIPDNQLEDFVIKMLSSIEVIVRPGDIVGVHRLGKRFAGRSRTVICRFVNRKDSYASLKNQRNLRYTHHFRNIWITENLCPTHRKVFNILYKNRKKHLIYDVSSHNGLIYTIMNEGDQRKKIESVEEAELFVSTSIARNARPNFNNDDNAGTHGTENNVENAAGTETAGTHEIVNNVENAADTEIAGTHESEINVENAAGTEIAGTPGIVNDVENAAGTTEIAGTHEFEINVVNTAVTTESVNAEEDDDHGIALFS